jgi:excisionase family DNA binding protein
MSVPLAYTIAEACVVARAGRTAIYEAIRSGELVARKRGRKTIILADDLRLWIERLPRLERNPGAAEAANAEAAKPVPIEVKPATPAPVGRKRKPATAERALTA